MCDIMAHIEVAVRASSVRGQSNRGQLDNTISQRAARQYYQLEDQGTI